MDTVRIAFFIGVLLFFFPVSYALQEPLAESSVYEPRTQSSLVNSLSGLLETILDLTDSIRAFISLVPVIISVTMNALSKLAAGELEYRDVAWCFEIIEVLAQELGLSRTYGAFVKAVMALTTGSLTVDDVYEILRVLPPLLRELPGAIARWLSIAYNLGFEVIFAPIAGGFVGLGIGAVAGAVILLVSILFFPAIAIILCIAIAIVLIALVIAIFIGFDALLFIAVVAFVVSAIIFGIILGAIIGGGVVGLIFILITIILFIFGFIWLPIALVLWLIALVVSAVIGAIIFGFIALVISAIVIVIVIAFELFLFFVALPLAILFIIAVLFVIGLALALFIGLPVGIIVGFVAFACITIIMFLLFTIGYPLMRWASLTGAL